MREIFSKGFLHPELALRYLTWLISNFYVFVEFGLMYSIVMMFSSGNLEEFITNLLDGNINYTLNKPWLSINLQFHFPNIGTQLTLSANIISHPVNLIKNCNCDTLISWKYFDRTDYRLSGRYWRKNAYSINCVKKNPVNKMILVDLNGNYQTKCQTKCQTYIVFPWMKVIENHGTN